MVKKLIKKRRSKKLVTIRKGEVETSHRMIVMRPGTVQQLCAKFYKTSSETLSVLRKRLTISAMTPAPVTRPDDPSYVTVKKQASSRRVRKFVLGSHHGDKLNVGIYFVSTRKHAFLIVVRDNQNVPSSEFALSKLNLLNGDNKVASLVSAFSSMRPFKKD